MLFRDFRSSDMKTYKSRTITMPTGSYADTAHSAVLYPAVLPNGLRHANQAASHHSIQKHADLFSVFSQGDNAQDAFIKQISSSIQEATMPWHVDELRMVNFDAVSNAAFNMLAQSLCEARILDHDIGFLVDEQAQAIVVA